MAQRGPIEAPLVEHETVRRVQVDVSVIDPRGDSWSSVPGLRREDFELRLDGRPLPPDIAERVEFDPICPGAEERSSEPRPTLIVLADLNFLDLRMRHKVAEALLALAETMRQRPLRVKVLAYTREITPLTEEFTSSPEQVVRAARALTEIIAAGPPRSDPPPPQDTFRAGTEESTPPVDREIQSFHTRDEVLQAFSVTEPVLSTLPEDRPSPHEQLARLDVDPRPSLTAIEAVLLAHAGLRGRKALVLFSSGWFELPEELWLSYTTDPRLAAQGGFTVWSVDAAGLATSSPRSRLLDLLGTSSGGGLVRGAGRLDVVFDRVVAQQSCYYLFSIPIRQPRTASERHSVDVRLHSRSNPQHWRYRVRTASTFTVLGSREMSQRRRLAGLMEPDAHPFPEARVSASYPAGSGTLVLPVEMSALLSDLTFQRDPRRGDYTARIAWEGFVADAQGRQVCRLGDGQERSVRSDSPPERFPPILLVLQSSCPLPTAGTYDARVVIEDLLSGDVGAARARVEVPEPSPAVAAVSAVRLGRASGRDFLAPTGAAKQRDIERDRARQAFIPLLDGESVLVEDRLRVRFVACGAPEPPHVILGRVPAPNGAGPNATGSPAGEALYQLVLAARNRQTRGEFACTEYEAVAPESSLPPGEYALTFLPAETLLRTREDIERALGEAPLARAPFRVVPPSWRPAPPPERPI
ncbi:MAG: hypothetical protein KBD01_10950 [Acidobacteria bacterium]|nr:hypothetical protein [Acidobacteriota bacterium]